MKAQTAPNRWFYRHPKLTLSAFALFGCMIAIILTELTARIIVPQWAPTREERVKFWTYDEILGWAHIPNQRGSFNHQDFSVEVIINSHGMRDSEYPVHRTEKKRMLILGDSFGWGFGVKHQERFSEILENTHADWEIINASVSGYSTDQQFLFLKEAGMAFKPDVVLLLFHRNDFQGNSRGELYWYFKPFFVIEGGHLKLQNVPVPTTTTKQQLDRILLGRTYLGSKFYAALRSRLSSVVNLGTRNSKTGNSDKYSGSEQKKYDVTYHLITAMIESSRKNGTQFVLVSIPMGVEERTFLQNIALKENIPYLQLDKYFESKEATVMFPHDSHWNANGHEVAANAIDAFLGQQGLFHSSRSKR
ncbi:MAG: SGNH/GDSL hydrolase family protein [bacterium]|nr:MAG: SGNH/GDSL hydrolase family protein [bacterium]